MSSRLSERLKYIEQMLGDSVSKHAQDLRVGMSSQFTAVTCAFQELADAKSKLDDMHLRVSGCEARWPLTAAPA